jgi:hypothetical protein
MSLEFTVDKKVKPINFGATGTEEILQNVRMILATPAYSCPMDREFAWDPNVDAPINVAQARQTARIVDAIRRYEPRAQVASVSFTADSLNGALKPVVRVRVADGAV